MVDLWKRTSTAAHYCVRRCCVAPSRRRAAMRKMQRRITRARMRRDAEVQAQITEYDAEKPPYVDVRDYQRRAGTEMFDSWTDVWWAEDSGEAAPDEWRAYAA